MKISFDMNAMALNEYSGLGAHTLEAICKLADMLQTTPKRAMELYLAHMAKAELSREKEVVK